MYGMLLYVMYLMHDSNSVYIYNSIYIYKPIYNHIQWYLWHAFICDVFNAWFKQVVIYDVTMGICDVVVYFRCAKTAHMEYISFCP